MSTTALIAGTGSGSAGVLAFGMSYLFHLDPFVRFIQYLLFEICLVASTVWVSWGCKNVSESDSSNIQQVAFCVECLVESLITLSLQIFCADLNHSIDAYYGLSCIFISNFIAMFIYKKKTPLKEKLKALIKGFLSLENTKKTVYEIEHESNRAWFWVLAPISIWMFISWRWIDMAIFLALLYPITVSITLIWAISKQPSILFTKRIQNSVFTCHSNILYVILVMVLYIPVAQLVSELDQSYVFIEFCLSLIPPFLFWQTINAKASIAEDTTESSEPDTVESHVQKQTNSSQHIELSNNNTKNETKQDVKVFNATNHNGAASPFTPTNKILDVDDPKTSAIQSNKTNDASISELQTNDSLSIENEWKPDIFS